MQNYLTVWVRSEGESTVVEVAGELDLASAAQLTEALELAWRNHPEQVVLELGGLHFIDMAGVRSVLEAQRNAEQQGGRLVLADVRQPVRRVLALAGMSDVFTIRENHS